MAFCRHVIESQHSRLITIETKTFESPEPLTACELILVTTYTVLKREEELCFSNTAWATRWIEGYNGFSFISLRFHNIKERKIKE